MNNRTPFLLILVGIGAFLLASFFSLLSAPRHAQASDGDDAEAWLPMIQLQEALADPSVASLGGTLHVIGGLSAAGPTDIHLQWQQQEATWQALPSMPVPRSDATTFVLSDTLYVLGGYNVWYGGAISYTHRYHAASGQWIEETAMLTPTSGASGALLNGHIYIFGGYDNISETAIVQSYDPVNREWTLRDPMPYARSEAASALLNDRLYIIGGNIFSPTMGSHVLTGTQAIPSTLVSVYDPQQDQWQTVAPLPQPRVDATAIARNGKIYLLGGTDRWLSGSVQNDVFIYDPQTDEWSLGPQLPAASGGLRGIVLDNRIYAVGGYDDDGLPIASVNIFDRIAATIHLPIVNNE